MNFKALELLDKPIFDKYYAAAGCENSEFTFTNMYIWRRAYQIAFYDSGRVLVVKGVWNKQEFYFLPLGDKQAVVEAIEELLQVSSIQLRSVPADWINVITQHYPRARYVLSPDDYDYVYSVSDLIELKGRKYEKKRHHINKLVRTYPEIYYQSFDDDLIKKVREHTDNWYVGSLSDDIWLQYEQQALTEVLSNWRALNIQGGALLHRQRVIAFTAGEQLTPDTAVIHIEKAEKDYSGAYQLINREFLKHAWQQCSYVNREEDMGIPELRIAKQSYYPVKMLEKYIIDIDGE